MWENRATKESTTTSSDIYGGRDPRAIPVYTYREAARCLNIPPSTLKAWAAGQSNFAAVLTPADAEQLSFFNLVEAWVVYDLRHRFHFSLQSLRRLFDQLRRTFPGLTHPIAQADLSVLDASAERGHVRKVGRAKLFAKHGQSSLLNLSKGDQTALETVLHDLLERVEKSPASGIARLHPFITRDRAPDAPKTIVVDPTVAFGKPVIDGTGIPTAAVVQLFNAGNSIAEIAEEYDRTPNEIEDAIRYESVRSKAA